MTSLGIVLAGILIITLFVCVFLNIFGLPGAAVIFLVSLVYDLLTGFESLGMKTLAILFALAAMAEIVDFSIGVMTSFYLGFSMRNFLAALVGAIAGMAIFTPFFLGVGTLLGFFLGGLGGVTAIELIRQTRLKPAFRAGASSILKRLCSTTVKGLISVVMVLITMTQIYS